MRTRPTLHATLAGIVLLVACSSSAPQETPVPAPAGPFAVRVDPATHGDGETVTVTISGLAPDETVALRFDAVGTDVSFGESVTGDAVGQASYRTSFSGAQPSARMVVSVTRASGESARSELRWTGAVVTAQVTPAALPSPSPTPAGFALLANATPGGFDVVVHGLDPKESFMFVDGEPGRPGVPRAEVADERGTFRIVYQGSALDKSCLLAKRATGAIARASEGPSGCPADVVYLYLAGPTTVRPAEFVDFVSNAPAGELIEFLAIIGPAGQIEPGWRTARVGAPPEGQLFRFSPDYERAGPLPAGAYTLSYRLMGQRYDFVLTLAR